MNFEILFFYNSFWLSPAEFASKGPNLTNALRQLTRFAFYQMRLTATVFADDRCRVRVICFQAWGE